MNCPNREKWLPMSTTDNPVTVIAEVDVNKASSQEMGSVVENGSFNIAVPRAIQQISVLTIKKD